MSIGLTPLSSVEQAFAWIDADGTTHTFGGASGYDVLAALRGRWMPPAGWIEDRAPGIPGTIIRGTQVNALDFDLPLLVTGASAAQLHQRLRDLMYWFDPRRGAGAFEATAPDGETRRLVCRAESVDVPEDGSNRGQDWQNVVVALHAPESYWYAPAAETFTYTESFSTPVAFLNDPFFPLNLTSSALYRAPTVDNPGTTESWPTWRISGPGTNPALRNTDTGEVMAFTRTLARGDLIVITLTRTSVTVTDGLGTRLYSTMTNPSVPWPIRPGINHVQIGMDGATSDSSVTLQYTPRFIGP